MPTLTDWAWVCLMLMQAMTGEISPNMRRITLNYENRVWHVQFVLEKENTEDREACEDIIDDFSTYLGDIQDHVTEAADRSRLEYDVVVHGGPLNSWRIGETRLIFHRRERSLGTETP